MLLCQMCDINIALAHKQAQLNTIQLHSQYISDKGRAIKWLVVCWMLFNQISLGVRVSHPIEPKIKKHRQNFSTIICLPRVFVGILLQYKVVGNVLQPSMQPLGNAFQLLSSNKIFIKNCTDLLIRGYFQTSQIKIDSFSAPFSMKPIIGHSSLFRLKSSVISKVVISSPHLPNYSYILQVK